MNISIEFTNTTNNKTYCFNKIYSSTSIKRLDLNGTNKNTRMFSFLKPECWFTMQIIYSLIYMSGILWLTLDFKIHTLTSTIPPAHT